MSRRKKLSRGKSRRIWKRTAGKMHKRNMPQKVSRGGTIL